MVDPVTRSLVIYFFALAVVRVLGKRSLAQMTSFDFVLLLIIAESTQQALLGSDFSLTNAMVIIVTLIGINYIMVLVKDRFATVERAIDGLPLVLVKDGVLLERRVKQAGLDKKDILEAARQSQGIASLEKIRYAIQECDGKISIIPFSK